MCILLFHTQIYNIHITHRSHSVHVTLGYWLPDSVIFHIPRRFVSLERLNLLALFFQCSSPGIPLCSLTFISGVHLWWNTTLSMRPSLTTVLNVSAHFYMNITHSSHSFSVFLSPELQFMGLQVSHGHDWATDSPQSTSITSLV